VAEYKIFFKKSAVRELDKIPKKDLKLILNRIDSLSKNPRPKGVEKLVGDNRYRIRQGNYRVVYSIQDNELTVWIVKVGHRSDVYQKLRKH